MRRVWEDWTEALALSWANALGNASPTIRDDAWHLREARYLELVKRYTPDEWRELAALIGPLTEALEGEGDPLGELYMTLDFGNERMGQFFTPWHLCVLNARVLIDDNLDLVIERDGLVTVDDPACGSAVMLLAAAHVVRERGFNPQRVLWLHGRDLSASAVHMAFINLAARGLPGMIEHGNTLTLEVFAAWPTPAHVLGRWSSRIAAPRPAEVEPATGPTSRPSAPLNGPIQPALANIDERVFRLHLAMKLLERVVEAELIRRARANEAGPAVPAEPDPPVPVAVSELDDDDPF